MPDTIHLPALLEKQLGISRSEGRRLIAIGDVKINGQTVSDLDIEPGRGDIRIDVGGRTIEAIEAIESGPRQWDIWVCPVCFELPHHLGEGVQGCGRHVPTTYYEGCGVWKPQYANAPKFIQIRVQEVRE